MSPNLIKAVIAIEDRRFFDHDGFDPIRIVGSAIAVARAGEAVQGGSTITQQLARQSVGREKTLRRKLSELLFAAQLETSLHQGRNSRAVSEQGVLRRRPLRRRSRIARLLRQEGIGVVAGRSVAARGTAEGAVELRSVARRRKSRSAPGRRAEGDAREQGDHARGIRLARSRRRSKSTTGCAPKKPTASTSRMKCAGSWSSDSASSASSRAVCRSTRRSIPTCSAPRMPRSSRASRTSRRRCRRAQDAARSAAGRADRDRSEQPAPCAPWSAAAIFAPAPSIAPLRPPSARLGVQAVHLRGRGRRRLRPR